MTFDQLPPHHQRRVASLNRLAALFGLVFRLDFATGDAEPFVKEECCVVPTNYRGEP